mgnify:FL=1
MKIQPITNPQLNQSTFNGIKINRVNNKAIKYLDIQVMNLMTMHRLRGKGGFGAVFSNDNIVLNTESNSIKYYLRKLGIKFTKDSK